MKLHIVPGASGEWTVIQEISAASIQLPQPEMYRKIVIDIQAQQNDRQITLDIVADVTITTNCDHCAEPFEFEMSPSLILRCLRVVDSDRESGDDNMKFIGLAQTEVDLEQDLRDMILLELPMRMVCCETDD